MGIEEAVHEPPDRPLQPSRFPDAATAAEHRHPMAGPQDAGVGMHGHEGSPMQLADDPPPEVERRGDDDRGDLLRERDERLEVLRQRGQDRLPHEEGDAAPRAPEVGVRGKRLIELLARTARESQAVVLRHFLEAPRREEEDVVAPRAQRAPHRDVGVDVSRASDGDHDDPHRRSS
jgi:hypothetical protein